MGERKEQLIIYTILGGMTLGVAGGSGYLFWESRQSPNPDKDNNIGSAARVYLPERLPSEVEFSKTAEVPKTIGGIFSYMHEVGGRNGNQKLLEAADKMSELFAGGLLVLGEQEGSKKVTDVFLASSGGKLVTLVRVTPTLLDDSIYSEDDAAIILYQTSRLYLLMDEELRDKRIPVWDWSDPENPKNILDDFVDSAWSQTVKDVGKDLGPGAKEAKVRLMLKQYQRLLELEAAGQLPENNR